MFEIHAWNRLCSWVIWLASKLLQYTIVHSPLCGALSQALSAKYTPLIIQSFSDGAFYTALLSFLLPLLSSICFRVYNTCCHRVRLYKVYQEIYPRTIAVDFSLLSCKKLSEMHRNKHLSAFATANKHKHIHTNTCTRTQGRRAKMRRTEQTWMFCSRIYPFWISECDSIVRMYGIKWIE